MTQRRHQGRHGLRSFDSHGESPIAHSRRVFLKTGAASIAVVSAGGVGWALTRTATAAREPWRDAANGFGDPRLDALAFAILAPNPHNMQPWLARLETDGSLSVFCDLNRRLPATDPFDRQITIGFGCFLELLTTGCGR